MLKLNPQPVPGQPELFNKHHSGQRKNKYVLDLFCGDGLAAQGYIESGFITIGADLVDTKYYPGYFLKMDWREALIRFSPMVEFIHASPPCQTHSKLKGLCKYQYSNYTSLVKKWLERTGKKYVIENVPGAMFEPSIKLTGAMFGLPLFRERWFWSNFKLIQPEWIKCRGNNYPVIAGNSFNLIEAKKSFGTLKECSKRGYAEGIPPIYTRYIGNQIIT